MATKNSSVTENLQLVDTETQVYKTRWWILSVFSLVGMTQAMLWNTWGPIAESLQVVFGWSDGVLALLPNLGNICFLLFVFPVTMIVDTKGLRISMIFCSVCLVICSALRCVPLETDVFTPLAYLTSFLQGFTAILPYSAPPLLSAVWFPVEERPTATAIGSSFNYFGVSVSFVIGPQLVPGPVYVIEEGNRSVVVDKSPNASVENLHDLKDGISNLMYIETAIAVFLFILVLVYFPRKPPKPPSTTASIERTDYKHALQAVLKNGPLWWISLAAALPIGAYSGWLVILDVIVGTVGVSQLDAGWMGFFSTVVGCIFGIIITKLSFLFHRRRKICLSVLFLCAGISVIWFALVSDSVLPYSLPSLYVSCILIGIFINGTMPLFYEMAAEAAYPVGEGLAVGFYMCINQIFDIIVLMFVSVKDNNITWLNWALLWSIAVAIPMLLLFPERYNRSDVDMNMESTDKKP